MLCEIVINENIPSGSRKEILLQDTNKSSFILLFSIIYENFFSIMYLTSYRWKKGVDTLDGFSDRSGYIEDIYEHYYSITDIMDSMVPLVMDIIRFQKYLRNFRGKWHLDVVRGLFY